MRVFVVRVFVVRVFVVRVFVVRVFVVRVFVVRVFVVRVLVTGQRQRGIAADTQFPDDDVADQRVPGSHGRRGFADD